MIALYWVSPIPEFRVINKVFHNEKIVNDLIIKHKNIANMVERTYLKATSEVKYALKYYVLYIKKTDLLQNVK